MGAPEILFALFFVGFPLMAGWSLVRRARTNRRVTQRWQQRPWNPETDDRTQLSPEDEEFWRRH